ncbi:hypothetical protein [Sphingobacterium gobiense]|uniref:Lipid A biosynthesis acyltransferase n=1 Tax=Sphingobacterium gobiense TaxID=1382456 RepID=A0A2S9JTY8_9SPHI|nr:hypothetical protein [Sphingobacterium gobiense]PRD56700.1 hypothetical protein C5749_05570 [Sphingobacterium gobiense]
MNKTLFEWPFALFSAHIHHFLPHIPWQEHEDLYGRFEAFHTPKPHGVLEMEHTRDVEVLLKLEPALLCLYHLGNHFETVLALARLGLTFDLLLDREVYTRQESTFSALQVQLQNNGEKYRFLFSDDRAVLLKMRTALRERKHVVVFADGNSGTVAGKKDRRTSVQFLGGNLQVKQGIAVISHVLHVPIFPLWMNKRKGVYTLTVADRIDPREWNIRQDFIRFSMQTLYDHLATEVVGTPWKWECWSYIHLNGSFDPVTWKPKFTTENKSPMEIKDTWIPVPWQGRQAYFDRVSYQLIC